MMDRPPWPQEAAWTRADSSPDEPGPREPGVPLKPGLLCLPGFLLESYFFSPLVTGKQLEYLPEFPLLLECFNDNILSYY